MELIHPDRGGSAVIHARLPGRLVIVGFGTIARAVLPLLLRHLDLDPARVTIVTADPAHREAADRLGIAFQVTPLTRDDHEAVLDLLVTPGDFILNLSVDVGSLDLATYAMRRGALYLDTCLESWAASSAQDHWGRTNGELYAEAAPLRAEHRGAATAVMTHGANPGLVSHFVKQALLDIAARDGVAVDLPTAQAEWAVLCARLGVQVIQIAERDTQQTARPRPRGVFASTWSIDGLLGEGAQRAEIGWGSHEPALPADGQPVEPAEGLSITLERAGLETWVHGWAPAAGAFEGMLLTHEEVISITDYFSARAGAHLISRPTCFYAYRPCDDTVASIAEYADGPWPSPDRRRILMEEIVRGQDELGVLLLGPRGGGYWYGSCLSIAETRRAAPDNNATSLQVAAGVLAGVVWAIENPNRGMVFPEEVDFRRALEVAAPYLGRLGGVSTGWMPPEDAGGSTAGADDPLHFTRFEAQPPEDLRSDRIDAPRVRHA